MSTRNFDSRVIVERLQNRNHSKHVYEQRARGQPLLQNPQTANGNASMATLYQDGTQTVFNKGLLGGNYTIEQGGPYGVPLYILPPSGTIPGRPSILTIASGDQSLTVFFIPNVNNGGLPLTQYDYSVDNGMTYTVAQTTSSPITITGLTNGIPYTVLLRAWNEIGPSFPSDAVQGTPATTPDAPTSLSVTSGNQQLSVSFSEGPNGGAAISNYQYSINNGGSYTTVSPAQTTSPIVITGLVNGTSYSVKLRAVNAIGAGAASSTVTGTPADVPSAPTILTTLSGNQSAYVYITNGTLGGSPITNYEYTLNGSTWIALSPADPLTPIEISGLTNGTTYNISVRAYTAIGSSPASNTVPVTPEAAGSVPTSVLYYDPNESSSYSGSGSTVANIGSFGALNGTKSGGVTYVTGTGISRNVFNFNGSDHISFGQYQFGSSFTISAWVYPRNKSSINGLLTNAGANQAPSGFKVGWNNWNSNNLTMLYEGGNGSTGNAQSTVSNTVVYDQWQYLTYIIDAANRLALFLRNGIPVDTASYSNNQIVANIGTNNPVFRIGTFTDGSYGMNAQLGYLKVYSGIRTVSEIQADYNASKSSFGL
jgi:hypothetical protein